VRLFELSTLDAPGTNRLWATNDGKKFAIIRNSAQSRESSIVAVLNWFEELKSRVTK